MKKLLLYLTNTGLLAASWDGTRVTDIHSFEHGEAGRNAFETVLADFRNSPAVLLVDLIEEDFQRDTIPHVTGRSRELMLERRLLQLYRDTPYRHASIQGREKDGRRDDRVLFSALLNADLVDPWVEAMLAQHVPLAGIYSAALLGAPLQSKLGLGTAPLLLVMHQTSGLRQSFFQDGQLRFSRLTQLPSHDPQTVGASADAEIAKTRQFLASTRLLQRDQNIRVVVLCEDDVAQALNPREAQAINATLESIGQDAACQRAKLKPLPLAGRGEVLLLSLLAARSPASHYSVFEQRRFYTLWHTRTALYAGCVATLAAGVFWAFGNVSEAFTVRSQRLLLEADTSGVETRYQGLMARMPQTLAKPRDMKVAVDLEQQIAQQAPTPEPMLRMVANALDDLPQIHIDTLRWKTRSAAEAEAEAAAEESQASGSPEPAVPIMHGDDNPPLAAALVGVPARPQQVLTIDGRIAPFADDYRIALDHVQEFAERLGKNPGVTVRVTRQPLDTRPGALLKGQAGAREQAASVPFAIRLVWSQ